MLCMRFSISEFDGLVLRKDPSIEHLKGPDLEPLKGTVNPKPSNPKP